MIDRDEGRTEAPVVGLGQLHRYLTGAYQRGADHQRDGRVRDESEMRIAKAEAWARDFIDLRIESGLIRAEPSGDVSGSLALGEWHGCLTGDCPDDGHDCIAAIRQHVRDVVAEATREPSGDVGEEALQEAIDFMRRRASWYRMIEAGGGGKLTADLAGSDAEALESMADFLARLRRTPGEREALKEIRERIQRYERGEYAGAETDVIDRILGIVVRALDEGTDRD